MPNFRDLDSLFRYIKEEVNKTLLPLGTMVQNMVRDYIWKNLYLKYPNPKDYIRTYNFLDSVSVRAYKDLHNNKIVEIYYDISKIEAREVLNGWNQHMNTFPKNDIRDYSHMMPEWIESGTTGSLWDRNPLGAMLFVYNKLNNNQYTLLQAVSVQLRNKGFKTTIKI